MGEEVPNGEIGRGGASARPRFWDTEAMMTNDSGKQETGEKPWRNAATLRELYIDNRLSMAKIAERFGCDPETVRSWMDRYGIERRSLSEAGEIGNVVHRATFVVDEEGYEQWFAGVGGTNVKRTSVHRLLAVAEFGFEAVRDKEVHHKNGIPWDNRATNIQLLTTAEHSRLHSHTRRRSPTGEFC